MREVKAHLSVVTRRVFDGCFVSRLVHQTVTIDIELWCGVMVGQQGKAGIKCQGKFGIAVKHTDENNN